MHIEHWGRHLTRIGTLLVLLGGSFIMLETVDPKYSVIVAWELYITVGLIVYVIVDRFLMPEFDTWHVVKDSPEAVGRIAAGLFVYIGMCLVAAVLTFGAVSAPVAEVGPTAPQDSADAGSVIFPDSLR